jgi:hypothetical protein
LDQIASEHMFHFKEAQRRKQGGSPQGSINIPYWVDGRRSTVGYAIDDRSGSIVRVWWRVSGFADLVVY